MQRIKFALYSAVLNYITWDFILGIVHHLIQWLTDGSEPQEEEPPAPRPYCQLSVTPDTVRGEFNLGLSKCTYVQSDV